MKKLMYKLMFLALMAMLAVPMFIKGPNGEPLMSMDDWVPDTDGIKRKIDSFFADVSDTASNMGGGFSESSGSGGKNGGQSFYKWQDANGQWQYSDKPNPAGQSESVYVNPDANMVSSAGFQPQEKQVKKGHSISINSPNPLTAMGQVPDMMNDINDIQKKMDARGEEMSNF